jgi:hypothetical protein
MTRYQMNMVSYHDPWEDPGCAAHVTCVVQVAGAMDEEHVANRGKKGGGGGGKGPMAVAFGLQRRIMQVSAAWRE